MELKDIKELIELVSKTDLTEVSIEQDDIKLSLKREVAVTQYVAQQPVVATAAPAPVAAPATPAAAPAEAPAAEEQFHYITAPLVGTFYSSPSPDAPPYVKVGDKITKGQTVCIVEAMKLMNEIDSDVDGTIAAILCENAMGVEYGTKIFAVKL